MKEVRIEYVDEDKRDNSRCHCGYGETVEAAFEMAKARFEESRTARRERKFWPDWDYIHS